MQLADGWSCTLCLLLLLLYVTSRYICWSSASAPASMRENLDNARQACQQPLLPVPMLHLQGRFYHPDSPTALPT